MPGQLAVVGMQIRFLEIDIPVDVIGMAVGVDDDEGLVCEPSHGFMEVVFADHRIDHACALIADHQIPRRLVRLIHQIDSRAHLFNHQFLFHASITSP